MFVKFKDEKALKFYGYSENKVKVYDIDYEIQTDTIWFLIFDYDENKFIYEDSEIFEPIEEEL